MSIDWPHMIVSMLLIFATVLVVQRTPADKHRSRGKRAAIAGIAAGLVIFIFNLIWPYGEGAGVTGESKGGREDVIEPRPETADGATRAQGT